MSVCKNTSHTKKSNAGKKQVWTKQIINSLSWIAAFLSLKHSPIIREWHTSYISQDGANVIFVLDASPWGLGGILYVNGVPIAFVTSPLTQDDVRIHEYKLGDSRGQQNWECLAVLVALRLWRSVWTDRAATVTMKSDNFSA